MPSNKITDTASRSLIGIDVGGTFTDLVQLDPQTGHITLAKTPTTQDNQSIGFLNALATAKVDLSLVDLIVHGTTTTTNALLEGKMCRTGLITTAGFRDVLELGRRTRPQPYGMKGQFSPVIPRDLRMEVPERMDAQGRVVQDLSETDLVAAIETLKNQGCESLVIHFLHSYANPAHEKCALEIASKIWHTPYITAGHMLLSESREFERGVTASVNASVQPLLDRYVSALRTKLADQGFEGDVLVMNGNGGMVSSKFVAREAAKTVMSGPASGVMAAAYTGRRADELNLLTYDMGGTSTDVALIQNGAPQVSNEIEVDYALPIHVPMVDVRTVGAGGGSIASVNAAGLLEIGPESAGAQPGPICYGRGGTLPTISDANMLLGRLDPDKLSSVEGGVTLDALAEIFSEKLGAPLGVDAMGAAEAVIRIANAKMAGAIRMVSLSLGADPRDFALFAFGGAGPLHAAALARELGVPRVLVPARPGLTNALGCVVSDLRHDYVQTVNQPLDHVDLAALHGIFANHIAQGQTALEQESITLTSTSQTFSADMQFAGQSHVVRVPLTSPTPTLEDLQTGFDQTYWNRFKVELSDIRARIVSLNTSIIGHKSPVDLGGLIAPEGRAAHATPTGTRMVRFDGDLHDTPIFWRDHLPEDIALNGPAIIEQLDTTILIPPGDTVTGGPDGNLTIHIGGAA